MSVLLGAAAGAWMSGEAGVTSGGKGGTVTVIIVAAAAVGAVSVGGAAAEAEVVHVLVTGAAGISIDFAGM